MANTTGSTERITQRRAEREKTRTKNRIVKAVAIAVTVYLILAIIFSMRSGVTTTIALNGTIKESVNAEGYIFRNQTLINSPANGYIQCRVAEGERVSKGQTIGYIFTGEYDAEKFQQMQEIDDKIEYLEGTASAASVYADNSVMVEQKISTRVRNLSDMRQQRNLTNTADGKDDINVLIERKKSMESESQPSNEETVTELKNRLSELENEVGGAKIALKTEVSGVFSSKIDSLEDKLSTDVLDKISPQYLAELDATDKQRSGDVTENAPVCKIINNYEWYFAICLDMEEARDLQIGQKVELLFFDFTDTSVYGNITNISPEDKGKVAVTIYANRYVEGIYSSSSAAAEIVTASASGIKLPVKSLRVKDGQTGVYVLRLGAARFVPVNVRYKNDEWAIVSAADEISSEYNLQIYDEVVVDAKNLEDGKVVR